MRDWESTCLDRQCRPRELSPLWVEAAPTADSAKPSSIDRRKMSPVFSELLSYQTRQPACDNLSASGSTKWLLSSLAWLRKRSHFICVSVSWHSAAHPPHSKLHFAPINIMRSILEYRFGDHCEWCSLIVARRGYVR
jgi:hypothetical protein